jgi:hypothetical protein
MTPTSRPMRRRTASGIIEAPAAGETAEHDGHA